MCAQDEFDFGPVFIGNSRKLPFRLANVTPVPALVTIDLRKHPELQLLLPKDNWSPAEYEACPMQRMGPGGNASSVRSSTSGAGGSGSRRNSRRNSLVGQDGFATDGAVFHVSLNPSAALDMLLSFRPKEAAQRDVELCVQVRVCTWVELQFKGGAACACRGQGPALHMAGTVGEGRHP